MGDDGGWGDLFALAEGSGDAAVAESLTSMQDDASARNTNQTKSKKRKRNRKDASSSTAENEKAFMDMLASRMDIIQSSSQVWPCWMSLGGSAVLQPEDEDYCDQWHSSNNNLDDKEDNNNDDDDECRLDATTTAKCTNCQKSALRHTLQVKNDNKKNLWPLRLFCHLRNIRCLAKLGILQLSSSEDKSSFDATVESNNYNNSSIHDDSIVENLATLSRWSSSSLQELVPTTRGSGNGLPLPPQHEAELLALKLGDLHQILQRLQLQSSSRIANTTNSSAANPTDKSSNNHNDNSKFNFHLFDDFVRLIMACDALFYKLHYLQITRQLPTMMMKRENKETACFIPHPTAYFGIAYITADPLLERTTYQEFIRELENKQKDSSTTYGSDSDEAMLTEVLLHIGLEEGKDSNDKTGRNGDHPLSELRRLRFLETVAIFHRSGWSSSKETQRATMRALEEQQQQNTKGSDGGEDDDVEEETPAPQLLMEWRDSCRDFPCHLYAYATLSETSVMAIHQFLQRNNIEGGIVEHGAGSGYLAKILTNISPSERVAIQAYDVCPTTISSDPNNATNNDYHGLTPPFVHIQPGDANTFRKELKAISALAKDVALLICYPPPQSSMAYDFLKTFKKQGGQYFVHIGEFRGLTGSSSFEAYLLKYFVCQERHPCLGWGTDASEVTMWMVKKCKPSSSNDNNNHLLLPCSCCRKKEAVRRCRLLRSLVYCTEECCKRHALRRKHQLATHMIQLGDKQQLDFKNEKHFSLLT